MNRQELIQILQKVKPGLANRDIIEQSTSFVFAEGQVMTYNDEIAVTHPIDIDFTGAIEADILYKYLSKLESEEIEIQQTESELILTSGCSKAGFKVDTEITLPVDELKLDKKVKWKTLPNGFIDAINLCLFSTGNDMSRPIFTCIYVHDRYVESTDNYRLTRVDLGKEVVISEPMLILAKAASELIKYDVDKYYQTGAWLRFQTADNQIIFSCRMYEDNYPDASELLNVKGDPVIFSPKIREVLDKASIFVREDLIIDEHVEIVLSGDKMLVKAEGEKGWFKESVQVDGQLKNKVRFNVNPKFLMDAISKVNTCIPGRDRIKFEGENFVHIIGLVSQLDEH